MGISEIILECIIDFILGNHGAILTYPISFVIQIWAIKTWTRSDKFKNSNLLDTKNGKYIIGLLVTLAIIFSFIINYIGYEHITPSNMTLYVLTILAFGVSLIANECCKNLHTMEILASIRL